VTEEETPNLPAGDLASIKVVFERGLFKEKSRVAMKDVAPGAEEYAVGPINEDMKKANMVGAMTECVSVPHPSCGTRLTFLMADSANVWNRHMSKLTPSARTRCIRRMSRRGSTP
jgi:hypothetical protein